MDGSPSPQRLDIKFLSLGMVVLDDLRFPDKAPLLNIMGGSGTYATLGARLFATEGQSETIGCLVLAGKDFPEMVECSLHEWSMTLLLKKDPNNVSTRGLLEYEDTTFGPKKFKYTTTPLKPSPSDLVFTPFLRSQTFHFLSNQEDIKTQITELLQQRKRHGVNERPLIMWEPFPSACQPENLESILDACRLVDMFSPNHLEMARLFTNELREDFQPEVLESYAQRFLDHSIGPEGKGCVVIRAAEYGSLTASRAAGFTWSASFYAPGSDTSRVVDPTGAGNSFIGGFAMGLQQKSTLEEAAAYGHVAASFALEQIGVPSVQSQGYIETWNGVKVKDRLEEYRMRGKFL